jgi:hypothetical protein
MGTMYRCKGLKADRKRCKRKTAQLDGYCPIHEDQRLSGPPLEVELEVAAPEIADFKDGDLTQRMCGHCCDLTLEKCCECTDARAADAVALERRGEDYCKQCKARYVGRLPRPPQMWQEVAWERPPRPWREALPRNVVVFRPGNEEDHLIFNIFVQIYNERYGRRN